MGVTRIDLGATQTDKSVINTDRKMAGAEFWPIEIMSVRNKAKLWPIVNQAEDWRGKKGPYFVADNYTFIEAEHNTPENLTAAE